MTSHSDGDATDTTNAIVGTVATAGDGVSDGAVATVTVTSPDDETIVNNGKKYHRHSGRTPESRRTDSKINRSVVVDGELRRRQRDHRPPPAVSLTAPSAQRPSPSPRATVVAPPPSPSPSP